MNHDEQTLAATLRGNPDLLRVNVGKAISRKEALAIAQSIMVEAEKERGQASERKPRSNHHAEAITLIVDLAHLHGWTAYVTRAARTKTAWVKVHRPSRYRHRNLRGVLQSRG